MPETQSARRLRWLLRVLLVWIVAIFARLVWLQVFRHDDLLRQALQQQQKQKEVPALRGSIFDRTGQPLAKSLPAESVCINPQRVPDASVAADLLAGVLGLDRAKLFDRIQTAKLRGNGFMWVKRKVDEDEAERLRKWNLEWVEFRPETRRFFPRGEYTAHVVGSTGMVDDEVEERGNAGIEAEFDEELAGRPGLAVEYTDVKQNAYDSVITRKPEPGEDITLTIDSNLQYVADTELAKAVASSGAKTGSIVALNPYTGDVLVMANYPRFDPNSPPGPNEPPNARSNLAITTPFEPGSVFKVITLTAAIEALKYKPETIIPCGSVLKVYDRTIKDEHPHGPFSMADVLAHSSNVGAVMIGQKVGDKTLYAYQRKFGFGQKTGIDLPGESAGLLKRVEDWSATTVDFTSFGHEVAVTSLQLALAGAAIANGGMMVKPRIVLSKQKPGEPVQHFDPEPPRRIIAPETAIQMREMMEGVVLRGTAKGYANLRGYTSGGKTGTAQIFDLKSHVYTHRYNASFLGFAPVENPQIVMIVTLEGTTGGEAGFGAPVAAPVFREVAMAALRMLDVPKDLPEAGTTASAGTGPARPDKEAGPSARLVAPGSVVPASLSSEAAPAKQTDSAAVAGNAIADPARSQRSVSSVTPPPAGVDGPAIPGTSASSQEETSGRRLFLKPATASPGDGASKLRAEVRFAK